MKRTERLDDLESSLLEVMEGNQANIWTALPGVIQSFNAAKMICTVQPTIQSKFTDARGNEVWVTLPLCTMVPLLFPSGGGYTLTFPVAAGDECLLVFSSRCIDAWWAGGGVQKQSDLRMHNLSDGFAIIGVRSQKRLLAGVSADATELRSDANTTKVSVKEGTITLTAPTAVIMNTPLLKVSGEIIDRYVTNPNNMNSMRTIYNNHKHPGVQPGTGTTGVTDSPE